MLTRRDDLPHRASRTRLGSVAPVAKGSVARAIPAAALLSALLLLLCTWLAGPAAAQLQLPGANNGVAPSSVPRAPSPSSSGAEPAVASKPVTMKPPAEETIAGHILSLNGRRGRMSFVKSGPDLTLTVLTLDGDKISKPNQTCTVDVALSKPLIITSAGRPAGTIRARSRLPLRCRRARRRRPRVAAGRELLVRRRRLFRHADRVVGPAGRRYVTGTGQGVGTATRAH